MCDVCTLQLKQIDSSSRCQDLDLHDTHIHTYIHKQNKVKLVRSFCVDDSTKRIRTNKKYSFSICMFWIHGMEPKKKKWNWVWPYKCLCVHKWTLDNGHGHGYYTYTQYEYTLYCVVHTFDSDGNLHVSDIVCISNEINIRSPTTIWQTKQKNIRMQNSLSSRYIAKIKINKKWFQHLDGICKLYLCTYTYQCDTGRHTLSHTHAHLAHSENE